jgi:uncharacterized protein YjiS (DUF1127 family)
MHALKADFFDDIEDLSDFLRPRSRSVIDRLVGRMAVGQIFGEQFVYEVHGPFIQQHRVPVRRRPLGALVIDVLVERLRRIRDRARMRQAAAALSRLDDRMLKDIGVARSDIAFAVRRTDPRS